MPRSIGHYSNTLSNGKMAVVGYIRESKVVSGEYTANGEDIVINKNGEVDAVSALVDENGKIEQIMQLSGNDYNGFEMVASL